MTYHIQVTMVICAIDTYQRFGMLLSRNGTPAHLRSLATAYTGKPYARSAKGLETARVDLVNLKARMGEDFVNIVPLSQTT
jgi:hypothetical protein